MKPNIEKKLFYEKNNKSSFFTNIFRKKYLNFDSKNCSKF